MAVPPPLSNKQAMRLALRHDRRAHVERLGPSAARDAATAAAIRLVERLAQRSAVALYRAIGGEMDTEPLARLLGADGHALALPVITPGMPDMAFAGWKPGEMLLPGPHGIPQPGPEAPPVAPDVIVAPFLGFDRGGCRLGQGAGCYDRAFARWPEAWRVGLGWSLQERAILPRDAWDVALHAVATEREWITCGAIA